MAATTEAPPKTAFITGCSSGIGRALAEELASRGVRVFAGCRRPEVLKALADANPLITALRVDVTDSASLDAAVRACVDAAGPIDYLWANAGISATGPLIEQEVELVRGVFETNVVGVVATVKSAAPAMVRGGALGGRGGTVVVTGSVTSDLPSPWGAAYCASKAAVSSLCRSLRLELAPLGVSVVHLYTGAVQSEISTSAKARSGLGDVTEAEASPWKMYADFSRAILERANISQSKELTSMPAADFARVVCDRVLGGGGPPHEVVAGGKAGYLKNLTRFLPPFLVDGQLRQRMMKPNASYE